MKSTMKIIIIWVGLIIREVEVKKEWGGSMSFGDRRNDEFKLFDSLIILPLFLQPLGDVVMVYVVYPERRRGGLRREALSCPEGVMVHIGLDVSLQFL